MEQRFIELHDGGKPYLLNANFIVCVTACDVTGKSVIRTVGEAQPYSANESYQDIVNLIREVRYGN